MLFLKDLLLIGPRISDVSLVQCFSKWGAQRHDMSQETRRKNCYDKINKYNYCATVQYKYIWVSVFHSNLALCVSGMSHCVCVRARMIDRERERESAPVPEIVVVSFWC